MAPALRFVWPVALMALIFFFSAQENLNSGLGVWDTIGRKLVHMAEYGLLWFLWWRALGWESPVPAVAITLAYAATDEYHQTFVTGRVGSPIDWAIDAAGVTVAILVTRWRRTALPLHHEVAGSGPAVLLLHAGVADSRIWEPQFRALADEFTAIRCDLPGYGRSPAPSGEWVTADEVAGVLDAAGVDRTAVVGNSFGGKVALELATRHPQRVERLVLFSPSVETEPDDELAAFNAEEERLYEAGDLEGELELNVRTWVQPEVPDESRRLVREMQRLAFALYEENPDAEPGPVELDPAAIDVPTTIYTGARDFPTYRQVGERLAREMPDATHVHLDWAGHLPGIERPEETTELIRASLAQSR